MKDKKAFNKFEVLTKYCAEKGYNFDLALKEFEQAEKYLDAESIQRLLKLTDEGNKSFILYLLSFILHVSSSQTKVISLSSFILYLSS